jgi:hypothetical protein
MPSNISYRKLKEFIRRKVLQTGIVYYVCVRGIIVKLLNLTGHLDQFERLLKRASYAQHAAHSLPVWIKMHLC